MNAPSRTLEVTPHVVRFDGMIYQISNICSVGASRYKVTLKDILMMTIPLFLGILIPIKYVNIIIIIPSFAYALRISSLLSRYYLHLEMNSGSSDLFHSNRSAFFMHIINAIEGAMIQKHGVSYTFSTNTGKIVNVNNTGDIHRVGDVGSVSNIVYQQHPAGPFPQTIQDYPHPRHSGQ